MRRSTLECDGCGEPLDDANVTRGEFALTLVKGGLREMRTADLCSRCFTKAAEAARATFSHSPIGPAASGLDKLALVVAAQRRDHEDLAKAHTAMAKDARAKLDAFATELACVREDMRRAMMREGGQP